MKIRIEVDSTKLRNQTFMSLASDLNCPYKYPEIVPNKYAKDYNITVVGTKEEKENFWKKFLKEQEECNKINGKNFDEYMSNIWNQLIDEGYIEECDEGYEEDE